MKLTLLISISSCFRVRFPGLTHPLALLHQKNSREYGMKRKKQLEERDGKSLILCEAVHQAINEHLQTYQQLIK